MLEQGKLFSQVFTKAADRDSYELMLESTISVLDTGKSPIFAGNIQFVMTAIEYFQSLLNLLGEQQDLDIDFTTEARVYWAELINVLVLRKNRLFNKMFPGTARSDNCQGQNLMLNHSNQNRSPIGKKNTPPTSRTSVTDFFSSQKDVKKQNSLKDILSCSDYQRLINNNSSKLHFPKEGIWNYSQFGAEFDESKRILARLHLLLTIENKINTVILLSENAFDQFSLEELFNNIDDGKISVTDWKAANQEEREKYLKMGAMQISTDSTSKQSTFSRMCTR